MNKHVPQRTCVICREKKDKENFFRLIKVEGKFIFDKNKNKQSRGFYICKAKECLIKLSKHKKITISTEEMYKMAKELEKNNIEDKYIKILNVLKNSNSLCFGMEMTLKNQEKLKMLILANDINQKNREKLMKLCMDKKIKYIEVATKEKLGRFFGKESINVIGIIDKKVANGLKTL
ncbi:hypothetical protein EV215_1030 [Hypnocyclicus thermotrophus]|uniref:LSU ribosomal protein L7AE n=1 Tax=Hypnocyclicus thermotrophus TaxID=1627895 RepID=A0AA46DYY2_9FUSO|nr:DUF448 domain-containing protein [Hypnocyclicus thermotrophus]TDT70485.1 hypothetical protein EV215_1030 [Hypnocyclicus thermotrophus]